MLTVHHLDDSRSQRILWLLEELALAYTIIPHRRDPDTRFAGEDLKAVHPLGKAPVLEDSTTVIAESGAIVDYLIRVHGDGRMAPEPGTPAHERYLEWLHYAEGSAMTPFLLLLYAGRIGAAAAPIMPRIRSEIANQLGYLEQSLSARAWLLGGNDPSGADVMMSFVGEVACKSTDVSQLPNLAAWLTRLQARPAYRRALERGGAYAYAMPDRAASAASS